MKIDYETNTPGFGPTLTLQAENQADAFQLGRLTETLILHQYCPLSIGNNPITNNPILHIALRQQTPKTEKQ